MSNRLYSIIKAKFLVNEDSFKNWQFIIFLILLAIIMIANTHNYEQKIYKITEYTNQVKELRSEFVDRRSELMKIKMESTVANKMIEKQIYPSVVPPKKISVAKQKTFWENLWQ